ncbi:MAG: DUF5777 family beta-barrel protein [Saprospiraceae bacterium]
MKNQFPIICRMLCLVLMAFVFTQPAYSQEEETTEKDLRPVKNLFEGIWLIDNQTAVVPFKGTFEFDIQHRFGLWKNGFEDLFGLYATSNMRLGFNYVPIERLMIGFGLTKTNITWDFNAKYALIQQARSGGSPVAVTYFVNTAIDTRDKAVGKFANGTDRYSYFHQLMVARKFSENLSLQVAGSLSHFNAVEAYLTEDNKEEGKLKNDHIAVALSGKYKVGAWVNIIANVDLPVTSHNLESVDPKSNISFGVEMTSSSHQFQIFCGNFYNITQQRNNVFNQNSFGDGNILIGFNITRLWNF